VLTWSISLKITELIMAIMKFIVVFAAAFLIVNAEEAQKADEKADPGRVTVTKTIQYSKPVVVKKTYVTEKKVWVSGGSHQVSHHATVQKTQTKVSPPRPRPVILGGCSVEIFQHSDYKGSRQVYQGVVGKVSRNDDMSSLKVPKGCCVTIYEHFQWKGKHQQYCGKDVSFVGKLWNDKMSSLRVTGSPLGADPCRVEFYEHANFKGVKNVYMSDTNRVKRNDEMSSLKVGGGCCAVIYEHYNYGGKSQKYCKATKFVGKWWNDRVSSVKVVKDAGCSVEFYQHAQFKGVKNVYTSDAKRVKRNDEMSSLKVGDGCCAVIYEHYNFGGKSQKYCGPVAFVGKFWNDKVSSVKVVKASYKDEEVEQVETVEKDEQVVEDETKDVEDNVEDATAADEDVAEDTEDVEDVDAEDNVEDAAADEDIADDAEDAEDEDVEDEDEE